MTGGPVNALRVAHLARDLVLATQPETLTEALLTALHSASGVDDGMCYRLNGTGDQLLPLASVPGAAVELPALTMDELDNPLVYCLVSGQPCHIDQIHALVDVGQAFEQLRKRLSRGHGALILPLRDGNRHAFGVLALFGTAAPLRAVRDEPLWQTVLHVHERLFAGLRENLGIADQARRADARYREQDNRARERAARLLAAEFVGISAAARHVRAEILRVMDSTLALLITGETGTGKDHAAWLIHQAGRRGGKFVPVNCAAIPNDLIEAELFGSERGAFTGAHQSRKGLVAEADGGTLFLDEIGDMPLSLQGTLLRLLNEKKYRPVGANQERSSDFRLICATHQPLPQRIADGYFREDLYFRIRQQTLHIPALRERPEDVLVLAEHVLLQHNREQQSQISGISAEARRLLEAHAFPGNVRELRSLMLVAAERTEDGQAIQANALRDLHADTAVRSVPNAVDEVPLRDLWHTDDLPTALAAFESRLIAERLRRANGSRADAAQSLGIPKRTLARKCLRWNLLREDSI